ncbi:DUF6266 family protein [Desertivirga arenae]|uniref:DUF6266 family protein n=1 Tax=Desertivirga arenae TaxID=2810309 RepID=UPI001A975834|nr:DUF6266 family protein [Pedobacter sp. SYSU D00823]
MASINKSLWLPSGSLGNMVFCSGPLRKAYVRLRPDKKKPRSVAQQLISSKLSMMEHFLFPFKALIKEVWKEPSKKRRVPYDCARSYFFHHSFDPRSPDAKILPETVQLSKGNLTAPENYYHILEGKNLIIRWQCDPSGEVVDYSSIYLAIYNEDTKSSMYQKSNALLINGELITEIPEGFLGSALHAYLIFLSPDGKSASATSYIKLT